MHCPLAVPLCLLLLACNGNQTPAPVASPQSAGKVATDKSVVQPTKKSSTEPPQPESPKPQPVFSTGGPHTGPVPGPSDPSWFKLDIFPGATITSSGRSQKDEQGLYSTQILFSLAAGTTREACVDALHKAAFAAVPNLQQTEKDGRVTLSGSNDDYSVTMLCGEAKGNMSAYLSYRWLRPPPAGP